MQDSAAYEDFSDDVAQAFVVPPGVLGARLDKQLAQMFSEHSRGRLQGWIEAGYVKVNGQQQCKVRSLVSEGDIIVVVPQPSEQDLAFEPQPVEFEVVDAAEHWIVVNKPVGLVVHPGAGNWSQTLLNGLLYRFPELATVARAGIVHRLDKDTSGLMVVARTAVAQTSLVRQLQARSVSRQYLAVAHGRLAQTAGRIDQPIGRDPRVAVRMTVQRPISPKEAVTDYALQTVGSFDGVVLSQVQCSLQTGRTHQIRVHLSSIGHPLVGDTLYGGKVLGFAGRQMLHARRLSFDDPGDHQRLSFEGPLPDDMYAFLSQVAWQGQGDCRDESS